MSREWWAEMGEQERETARRKHDARQEAKFVDPLLLAHQLFSDRLQRSQDIGRLNDLNPIDEPLWTVGMALAWIATREARIVANMWEKWCGRNVNSSSRLAVLMALEEHIWSGRLQLPKASGELLKIQPTRTIMSLNQAWAELSDKAQMGEVTVSAIEDRDRANIPAARWSDMTAPHGTYDEIPWKLGHKPNQAHRMAARFPLVGSARVIELWPRDGSPVKSMTSARDAPASAATIERAIRACMAFASERRMASPTRDEITGIVQETFSGTSRTRVREVLAKDEIATLFPARNGPRGPRNNNRNREIEEIRQFLSAADLRN